METKATMQRYLIYFKGYDGNYGGHAVMHLVEAPTPMDALWQYIRTVGNTDIVRRSDGSLEDDGIVYAHPLAYIEAGFKRYGEWQMRLLLEPTQEEPCTEAFCGESDDGPAEVISDCRKKFGKKRAGAFVWYLKEGTLVTFYRKSKPFRIKVLGRCLWNYDGTKTNVKVWKGDYAELMEALYLTPYGD